MSELQGYRNQIDEIDREIIALFEKRLDVVLNVADYKRRNNLPVLNSGREGEVLDRAEKLLANPDYTPEVRAFMQHMMDVSKGLQKRVLAQPMKLDLVGATVGFQGTEGSFSEEALRCFFGEQAKKQSYDEFEDVFEALKSGEISYGVVPIENSNTGAIGQVYDLLQKYGCYIVGEQYIRIDQYLMSTPEATLQTVKEVYSHAQGISQCSEFLKQHTEWKQIPYHNTAVSARYVSEEKDPTKAAIAGESAAKLYGLKILQGPINNLANNTTRFVIVSKEFCTQQADKVSIVFSLDDRAGTLYHLLHYFAQNGINLVKIESRPMVNLNWKYFLYLDFEGEFDSAQTTAAIQEIQRQSEYFRVLGAYRKNNA